jgi:Holliday junction resolvase
MVNSIRKGKQREREIVNILKAKGYDAKRISMMETQGIDKGDIEVKKIGVCQVKSGGHVPKALYKFLEHERICFARRDNERWLVICELDTFLNK